MPPPPAAEDTRPDTQASTRAAAAFWDRLARKYAQRPIRDETAYRASLARIRAHVTAHDRILELGAGTSSTALLLAEDVAHVTSTDLSPEMIAIGREKAAAAGVTNIDLVAGTPADPGFPRGPFDAVLALNLLHLIPDLDETLADIHDMLRPEGLFISKTPCLMGPYRLLQIPLAVMRLFGRAPWVGFYSPAKLEARIEAAGFELLERGDYPKSPPSRFIVARRR